MGPDDATGVRREKTLTIDRAYSESVLCVINSNFQECFRCVTGRSFQSRLVRLAAMLSFTDYLRVNVPLSQCRSADGPVKPFVKAFCAVWCPLASSA